MLDSVNNYIYDTGDKRVNLLGRSDFRTYSNVLGRMINIEVKCQPRCHEFGQIAIKKENIKKAKNEHADYLFIVDDRGDVVGHRINDEIVGKQEFDFGNLSEIRQELVSKLVADKKIEENFEIY